MLCMLFVLIAIVFMYYFTCISFAIRPSGRKSAIKPIDWLGRKINLSGISPAKRSRSRPNSVHMDMSRGDNVQRILGAISPVWVKLGQGRVPGSASFLFGKPRDLSATSQRLIFIKFGHEHISVSRRGIRKDRIENFYFRGHLPQKSEIENRSNRHLT